MNLKKIKEALLYGEQQTQDNIPLFAEGRNAEQWKEIRESHFYANTLQEVVTAGKKYLAEPIRSLRFSDYKIYDTSGSRKEFETEYFNRRGRLNTFAILSMVFGEDMYISALEDAIWAICDEYSWCLPAHFGGESLTVVNKPDGFAKSERRNRGNIREQDKNVDLFASETGFALTEICSLLENRLAPLVVHRARKLVRERILEPYCDINSMFWWETTTNNWAAVCAGSVGAAALYLIQDSAVLAPVILRVLNTLEAFLSGYEEDGACTEGLSYWNYGFGFYVYFSELLRQRTAGKIDILQGEKLRQISLFQQKCYLSKNKVVSFSDGALASKFLPGLTNGLHLRFPEVEIPDLRYRGKFSDDHCHRWASDIRNFIWSSTAMEGNGLSDASYYLKDAQWLISRKNTGNSTVAFAAKGGHNDEPHNHNDVGNFILHINGESLLTDTGAGEYTKQYFGPERYSYLCNSSMGHSVPVINGRYQSAGKEYTARILEQASAADREIFIMDIAKAYPDKNLLSLIRDFSFEKTEQPRLVLSDRYCFEKAPEAVTERFVSFREPRLLKPGKAEIAGDSGSVIIVYDPEMLDFTVEKNIFLNHAAQPEDIYFIDLKVKKAEKDFTVTLAFEVEIKLSECIK